ncbi:MAG TPA: M3 family peptidase, partial [Actinotalea sp.]|nr:M3 family peptidase [Actinotalea sp.]
MTAPSQVPVADPTNPFAAPSDLPYGLPDFTAIRDEHYRPAFLSGMAQQRAEVEAILTDGPPTEDNTLLALERSGATLHRVAAVFFNRTSADSTPELDDLEAEIAPLLSEHHDAIDLDPRLLSRLEVLAARAEAGEVALADDAAWLLETLRRTLRRAGAATPADVQDRLRALNARISTLETAFGRELLAEANESAVLVRDVAELDGLAADAIAAARQAAEDRGHGEGWLLELSSFSQQPVLASLTRRDVRRRVHEASLARGARGTEHDTRATLLELVRARAERARLL